MLRKMMILVLTVVLLGAGFADQTSADTGFSLSVGTDDFYLSVGNYDYYSYGLPYYNRTPRISFYNVMGDYGTWVSLSPFGRVWRPHVRSTWRPYVNGHWTYTRYGPTWVGYEPWAWAGYHYGNWIWSSRYGWVWIPGYDWHPGRVIWSHGYDTIGWMPAPPTGYDYSSGYLGYRGSHGQFDYYDDDFGYYDDNDYYYRDRNRYNPGYSNPFYGSGYRNIVVNLWVFIDVNHYRHHNYADYYLDSDYTRTMFDRRAVRISSRPIQRQTLERIVKHKVQEASVQEREIESDNRRVKVVVPAGEEENIRRNANRVVKKEIAPAFAEKRQNFKGAQSANAPVVNKVFKQENKQPKVKKQTVAEVLREIDNENAQVERQRKNRIREKTDKVIRSDEAAKSRGKQQPQLKKNEKDVVRPGNSKDRPEQVVQPDNKRNNTVAKPAAKPNQKERDQQFEKQQEKKQTPKPFEARPLPKKEGNRESNSGVNPKTTVRPRQEPVRKLEPVERNSRVETERDLKQENNGSAKAKAAVEKGKDEEEVKKEQKAKADKKKADKKKSDKKKKEDLKKKKQG